MALINDFARFTQWLGARQPSEDVRKTCAVVEANLAHVARTTHAGGQRSRLLVPLLRAGMDQAVVVDQAAAPTQVGVEWDKLTSLEIGPFRGFRRKEVFDLCGATTLILGGNGTGKSSLCEALELALLGRIEEADERGLGAKHYFNNAHEGKHKQPVLLGSLKGASTEIKPDEELHRFIIVERNRIEGFARIGARRPAEASRMLAALFGLTAFNDFVSGFASSLDSQLDLALPKAAALELRRAATQADQAKVASTAESHGKFDEERAAVAAGFEPGLTYADLKARIGTQAAPGRLQEIRDILKNPLPALTGSSASKLVTLRRDLRDIQRQLKQARAKLEARSREVSFRSLYQAVVALEATRADRCPACETPLDQVATNPFRRATDGLQALRELALLEQQAIELDRRSALSQAALEQGIRQVIGHAERLPTDKQLAPLDQPLSNYRSKEWRQVLVAAKVLGELDAKLAAEQTQRDALSAEAEKLQGARNALIDIQGRQTQFDADVAAARERLAAFERENAELLKEVEAEAAEHQVKLRIQKAYAEFLDELKSYRDGLPQQLLADLNEVALDLYNSFNLEDQPADLLEELRLPLRGGDPIQVRFRGTPDRWQDALAILSEGHVRCLGLAILLAKNIKLGLPVLLLDDAVNAIDHDHREGIRTTLFGHPELVKKQLIISCHSDEFIKDIHNRHAQDAELYILRHHDGDHHPRVSGGKTRNYIKQADACLADYNLRGALSHSRQALEGLLHQMWKKLAKEAPDVARFSLELRGPGAPPDTRNVAEVLLSRITKALSAGTLKAPWDLRGDQLDLILKAKVNSRAWISLNKGTHEEEDRDDFEEPTVRRILQALTAIDRSLR
ncbi:MAG TPA: AAA family ATPase [Frateuria sp.]|uniref:AAA family ATPase n=1 Tax=Frateuria sp. TaxID=2211372 RepID=UPI002D80FE89|nr:AAA family ATPase [Frateuria sp.]HET6805995.1 AAA family ATPase [Frateuria sp.]